MLKQRVITALILAPLAIWGIFALNDLYFSGVIGVIILLGFWEWGRLVNSHSKTIQVLYTGIGAAVMILLHLFADQTLYQLILYTAMVWWLIGLVIVLNYPASERWISFSQLLRAIAGLIVLIPAWLGLVMIHQQFGSYYLVTLMLLVWGADVGAYFAGRYFGKHKLAPNVSPKKTWEGVIGGMVMALVAVFVMSRFIELHHPIFAFMLISLVTIAVSVLGDLVESLFKRSAGIKDSGGILPGHGGILDRIDSLTAAAPFFITALVI